MYQQLLGDGSGSIGGVANASGALVGTADYLQFVVRNGRYLTDNHAESAFLYVYLPPILLLTCPPDRLLVHCQISSDRFQKRGFCQKPRF
jgi:hypothetical protein